MSETIRDGNRTVQIKFREPSIVEIASNDGYLLQYFVERRIPVLGIEPAANVAEIAESKGIPSVVKFFGEQLRKS